MLCVTGQEQISPNLCIKRENRGIRLPTDITCISAMLCNMLPPLYLKCHLISNVQYGCRQLSNSIGMCIRNNLTGKPISGTLGLALSGGEC